MKGRRTEDYQFKSCTIWQNAGGGRSTWKGRLRPSPTNKKNWFSRKFDHFSTIPNTALEDVFLVSDNGLVFPMKSIHYLPRGFVKNQRIPTICCRNEIWDVSIFLVA